MSSYNECEMLLPDTCALRYNVETGENRNINDVECCLPTLRYRKVSFFFIPTILKFSHSAPISCCYECFFFLLSFVYRSVFLYVSFSPPLRSSHLNSLVRCSRARCCYYLNYSKTHPVTNANSQQRCTFASPNKIFSTEKLNARKSLAVVQHSSAYIYFACSPLFAHFTILCIWPVPQCVQLFLLCVMRLLCYASAVLCFSIAVVVVVPLSLSFSHLLFFSRRNCVYGMRHSSCSTVHSVELCCMLLAAFNHSHTK